MTGGITFVRDINCGEALRRSRFGNRMWLCIKESFAEDFTGDLSIADGGSCS